MGGRPKKWASNTERMRFVRAQVKVSKGKPLTGEELYLIHQHGKLGRPMSTAERKRLSRFRATKK